VNCWLRVLKNDKRAIFTAASQAAKATDFILTYWLFALMVPTAPRSSAAY
jgi:antirestriction protein ArdC